jgi:3-hydroxybutyryl-CoA dehydrogenase
VLGTAYPIGPLAWGDTLGASTVFEVLTNLHAHYGDPRYRRSPRLQRAHFARQSLHA